MCGWWLCYSDVMASRGVMCVWLVAVVQLGSLLVVSVVQQLNITELTHSDMQLRLMLIDIIKGQPDYTPSDTAMEVRNGLGVRGPRACLHDCLCVCLCVCVCVYVCVCVVCVCLCCLLYTSPSPRDDY